MSKVLGVAVKNSLKAAHAAYLVSQHEAYCGHIIAAENAVAAIKALGAENDYCRTIELMALEAELLLIRSLSKLSKPRELIPKFEMAMLQMLIPPSQIVDKSAPMLPGCTNALEYFGGASEQTARDIERAVSLYAHMTDGGGGGIPEIYRAQMESQKGCTEKAAYWARRALDKMCGDKWIEPIASGILAADKEKKDAQKS